MNQQELESLLKKNIEDGKNTEITIDERAKVVIKIKKTIGRNYISTLKYILDKQEVHLGTLRELINRLVVSDIDKYFEENIWTSTSAHGENNLQGLINLTSELLNIDTMDVIMHPQYHYNQWRARNPYVSFKMLKNGKVSGYHKNYKGWLDEGIEKGFINGDDIGELGELDIIENYVHTQDKESPGLFK